MKNLVYLMILIAGSFGAVTAQKHWAVSVFNHATALPGGSWAGAIHPGVDVGLRALNKRKAKSETYLQYNLGYYYHRLVHHGAQLYGEYHWDFNILPSLGAGLSGGLGALYTKEIHEIFKLQDGGYARTGRWGKLHGQVSTAFKIWYRTADKKLQPFVAYRFRLVSPFVQEYVPLLPSVSLHAGLAFSIN